MLKTLLVTLTYCMVRMKHCELTTNIFEFPHIALKLTFSLLNLWINIIYIKLLLICKYMLLLSVIAVARAILGQLISIMI